MLHSSCNRYLYIVITISRLLPYPPIYRPTSFIWKPGQGFRPQVTPTVLILIQSCRSFSEVKHCRGPHLWTLLAAFKKLCSNKQGPVTGSLARNVMHLEQIWAVRRLLLGLHAQKKQCFVLDSWIITVTAEHSAKLANSKMRPEDAFMHHDLRFCCMFLPEKGLWQGRLEAQVFRMLAPIRMPAFISLTTLRALSDKSLAKRSTALRKDHWMSTSRHSRKNYLKCLKNALAFSAPNQAHNLTNIFHTNAFSNMLLEGSSARVLQRSLLPSYTGAVFNSSGARLRELCQQGGTKLSQDHTVMIT